MARGLTSGLNAEVNADELEPIFLIDLEFDSGELYFWNGVQQLTWNGNEYIGGGNLINISPIVETNDIRAVGVNLSMSGLPASLISIALTEAYQGQPVKIRFAALSSGSIIADPYLIFDGRMDVLTIDDMAEGATINISAESRMIDLERPRLRRYTPQDQKIDHPNDTGLDYVPVIQDTAIQWGR